MSEFTIRPFSTLEEFARCVRFQEEIWGVGFSERVSLAILKVTQRVGGVSAGAYDEDGELVGFVFGMTGIEDGEPVHWSDMLAVREGLRDSGLGTRLKRYQRGQVLALGVRRIYWTFDPLESRNAYVNFAKLGIVVREYVPDMYGETDSPLHAGLGTDRFVALWLIDSDRVVQRLAGAAPPSLHEVMEGAETVLDLRQGSDGPGDPCLTSEASQILMAIPADIQSVKARSMETALAWRRATRDTLLTYLSVGYEVRELLRGEVVSRYLLVRNDA